MPRGVYRRRFRQHQKQPPGLWCLHKPEEKLPVYSRLVNRCKCPKSDGQWVVLWRRQVYLIHPPTQLQKDIWLVEARRRVSEKVAINSLRWLCAHCRTVQRP